MAGDTRTSGQLTPQAMRYTPHQDTHHRLETLLNGPLLVAIQTDTSHTSTQSTAAPQASLSTTQATRRTEAAFNGVCSITALPLRTIQPEGQTTTSTSEQYQEGVAVVVEATSTATSQ